MEKTPHLRDDFKLNHEKKRLKQYVKGITGDYRRELKPLVIPILLALRLRKTAKCMDGVLSRRNCLIYTTSRTTAILGYCTALCLSSTCVNVGGFLGALFFS